MHTMEKKFKLTLLNKCPTMDVIGNEISTLDSIWDSQKCWFSDGTKVLISDGEQSKIFEKKTVRDLRGER